MTENIHRGDGIKLESLVNARRHRVDHFGVIKTFFSVPQPHTTFISCSIVVSASRTVGSDTKPTTNGTLTYVSDVKR